MNRIFFSFLFLALTVCLSMQAQQVVELKQPTSNKIIIKLMFRAGSICDPKGKEGLTDITANTITRGGTATKTSRQIQEFIYPMAASFNTSVDKEVTVFTFAVHKDFLDSFYTVIKGLMLTPSFTEPDFNRIKANQQVYVDQVVRASSDEDYSKFALEDLLFRGSNYQHMVAGTSAGVASITLDDVKQHYKNYFTRDNLMIGIAGSYSPAFLAKLKTDMAKLPSLKKQLPDPGRPNNPNGLQVEIISKPEALGSAIFTGFPLSITRSNNEFAALMVANSFLGEHRKSYGRLYDKIRTTRSMNYGDYSYIEWYEAGGRNMLPQTGVPRHSNYFSIWIRPVQIAEGLKQQYSELKDIQTGHAVFSLKLALREMDNLIRNGLSKEDFEATRTFLRSYNKLYVQTPEKRLGFLMDSRFYGRTDYIKEMDALLAKLTLADVNNAIKKYWQTKNMFISIVTDDSEAPTIKKALEEGAVTPMSYSNLVKEGLPIEVLKEDEEIAKYPLNIKGVKIVDNKETFKEAKVF
jgi:zinc protease